MSNDELKRAKEQCLADIRQALPMIKDEWNDIDQRVVYYVSDAIRDDIDTANVYELLGIRKVIRLYHTYHINKDRVLKTLRAIEGVWKGDKHVSGGLRFDTPRGAQHVRLMPYQVWCIFGIYAFDTDIVHGEKVDIRRLITEADIFQTRKSGKTEFGAALDFVEAMVLGPSNAQVVIIGNSKAQAIDISYKAVKKFCYQVDPDSANKSGGKFLRVTANEVTCRPGMQRSSSILAVPAGGKPKDGYNASMVHADEHGQAGYVKGHSDMEDTVQVFVGSMGTRQEKLTLHTTTAGLVNEGPYQQVLRTVEENLIEELNFPIDKAMFTDEDSRFSFLLRLDPWDFDGDNLEMLNKDNLFRKVNRSIGTTVQPTWYRERLHDAITNGSDVKKEVLTKDFNIWQTDRAIQWIQSDTIRQLQVRDVRVTDLSSDEWICFVGCDFSMGDDLNAVTYLCHNTKSGEFFADMDLWISEAGYEKSPNKHIYDIAIAKKYLHICKGRTIDDNMVTSRIMEVAKSVTILRIGYDPYSSMRFVNTLSTWIFSLGQNPKDYITPVSQSIGTSNGPVQDITWMVMAPEPLIHFSDCALWGWCFANCSLEEDKYGNRRPFKSGANKKIDPVVCLIMATKMYNDANGTISQ